MSRNLYYATIPIANAKLINFSEVMVHWNGSTVPESIASILKTTRGKERSHVVENTTVRSSRGQAKWGAQPLPPTPPRR